MTDQGILSRVYDIMSVIMRPCDEPRTWPRNVRRAYLIVWPISAPLRAMYTMLMCCIALVLCIPLYLLTEAEKIWNGRPY